MPATLYQAVQEIKAHLKSHSEFSFVEASIAGDDGVSLSGRVLNNEAKKRIFKYAKGALPAGNRIIDGITVQRELLLLLQFVVASTFSGVAWASLVFAQHKIELLAMLHEGTVYMIIGASIAVLAWTFFENLPVFEPQP